MTAPVTGDRPRYQEPGTLGAATLRARRPPSKSLALGRLRRGIRRQWLLFALIVVVVAVGGVAYDLSGGVKPLSALLFWAPIGVAAGFGVALVRELARNTVTSLSSFGKNRGYAILGAAPELTDRALRQLPPDKRSPLGCLAFQPASPFATAFRDLQNAISKDGVVAFAGALAMSGQIKSVFAALSPLLVLAALSVTGLAAEAGDVAKLLLFVPLVMARFEALDALRTGFIERGSVLRASLSLLSLPPSPVPQGEPAKPEQVTGGAITFKDVKYVPPGSDLKVLDGVTLEIPKGAVVGVCGRSGGGKSTLVRLLLRLDEPTSGSIDVDGVALVRFDADALAQTFAVLGQSSRVFERTIGENLRMGIDEGPDDAKLKEILRLVKLDMLAEEGENKGLSTRFKAVPPSLSGGEQRRVLLARMLARKAKVFVLDEPEAGLPSATAEELLKAVAELAAGRTCIVVTHAPHLLASTFNVVIDEGKVVATGSHAELVEKSEPYRKLLAEGIQRAARAGAAPPGARPPGAVPPLATPPGLLPEAARSPAKEPVPSPT